MQSPSTTAKPYDSLSAIIAYEQGELDQEDTIELFQHLVDSGLAWQLQGHYGRTARNLIDSGYITTPGQRAHVEHP